MSAEHDDGSQLISISLGTLLPAVLGGVVGCIAAMTLWPSVDGTFFTNLVAGAAVGGIMSLVVAWFLAWHATTVGVLADRPPLAMAWGIIPGALLGATLGPVFAGVVSLFFGNLLATAILFGAFLGPIVGILGWQIGFFAANFLAAQRHHAH